MKPKITPVKTDAGHAGELDLEQHPRRHMTPAGGYLSGGQQFTVHCLVCSKSAGACSKSHEVTM
jgi:hypothetical protein